MAGNLTRREGMGSMADGTAARLIALFLAAFGFLPIANWIPGGEQIPWYGATLSDWMTGSAIVVGGGIVLAILSRRLPVLWRDGLLVHVRRVVTEHPTRFALIISAIALAMYIVIATTVLSARPLLIDELAQLLQARIYASGALTQPADAHPEFFSAIHMVDTHGTVYSQFPPGGPAMLAIGELIGMPWLIGPLSGAVSVIAFAFFLRRIEYRPGVVAGASALFAFAPFVAFMSGSHMNHVTTLMWLLIAIAAMAHVFTSPLPRPWLALLSGAGLGMAASIRPVDALAFALPAGIWYLSRAVRDPARWSDALAAALGVGIPVLAVMWVNARTTGSPLLFGYEVLWGKGHALGFHTAPWGDSHTPARGIELLNLYMLRLQIYLFETPIPSLVPAILALALTRKLERFDRYLLSSAVLLLGLYFAYWHDGFYLGPRFVFPLAPILALWTARLPDAVRVRWGGGGGLAHRTVIYGIPIAFALAIAFAVPVRARLHGGGLLTMRWDADSATAASKIEHALVLVRESWGAQIVARMWALGITRPETELLYRHIDTCRLDEAISALGRANLRGAAAMAVLRPMLRDSSLVIPTMWSHDRSERVQLGSTYSLRCARRLTEDGSGFTLLMPLLLARNGGNIYARDLHEQDTLLLRRYPDRSVYLLSPPSAEPGAMPRFVPLSRDSLWRAWREGETQAPGTRNQEPGTR